ncbi:MAG: hypothetical protein C5B60_05520 [Chloroflexi bacterium]|nr:MAG: hypothetical protein C5B60_05520 [Chloroflexota bacterium]
MADDSAVAVKSMIDLKKKGSYYVCPECGQTHNKNGEGLKNREKLVMHRVSAHQYKLQDDYDRFLWGTIHNRNRKKKPAHKGPTTFAGIDPATEGPWQCPQCGESFSAWMGFARHGRKARHFTIPSAVAIARKRYIDGKYHRAHPYQNPNGKPVHYSAAEIAPTKPKRNRLVAGYYDLVHASVMPYREGYLILLTGQDPDSPRSFYGFPVTLTFAMPKPKVEHGT